MSIADGQKIGIKFTQPLTGDVSGLTPAPVGGYATVKFDISGATVTTLNQYSTTYTGAKTVDGDLATLWWGNTAINWIKFQLAAAKKLTKFRLYMGSYYIKTFTISGSNDGTTFTQIGGTLTGASSTTAQWYEFEIENDTAYLYYRIDTLTAYSTRIYLYEVEFYENVAVGNEAAFTVTGQEYDMEPEGTASLKTYTIASVEAHPTEPNSILLTVLDKENGFRNVDGDLTVAYNSMLGNLSGAGGSVPSFSESFTPESLVRKPDINDPEHIEIASVAASGTLTRIYYPDAQDDANARIEIANITASGTLTHIDDI